MKDLFGKAILDFQTNNSPQPLVTETNISDPDEMDVAYLFRNFDQMPQIEQQALALCSGSILDVGCGAGSHSLYLQQKNEEVTSIDISENAIKTCQLRGVKNPIMQNLLEVEGKFDTVLLLMNGTGIFETLEKTDLYLKKLKSILNQNGQILVDSSDIIYMFDEDEDGGKWIPSDNYYGELVFTIHYKNQTEESFPWLYLDYNTLQNAAIANGLQCQLIAEGEHFDYLARLFV